MGFLDRFFDSTEIQSDSFWASITGEDEIDAIILSSNECRQVIFKHSNQCGTSFFAKKNLETLDKSTIGSAYFYLIDVIRQRNLSRYFEEKVGVRHESPQLFVIFKGEIIWHGSHHQVNEENLKIALDQALG